MELLLGLIGAGIGAALFCGGFAFAKVQKKTTESAEPMSEEYAAALKEAKEQFAKEQAAFLNLMQYNSDMAYGIAENKQE